MKQKDVGNATQGVTPEDDPNKGFVQLYDFEDYLISEEGIIKSTDREGIDTLGRRYAFKSRELKPRSNKQNPHRFVEVTYEEGNEKYKKTIYVHRAVAEHFLDPPSEDQIYIINIDGDYTNCHKDNLKWATKQELAAIHYPKRVQSTKKTWITRRKKYGKNGLPDPKPSDKKKSE